MKSCKTSRLTAWGATLATVFLLSAAAYAFGTMNSLGQRAEHEKITRLSLAELGIGPRTMLALAGKGGTFGAVGAPDVRLLSQASAHCDGGDALDVPGYPQSRSDALAHLEACRRWIFDNLEQAVQDANALVDADGDVDGSQIPTLISCTYTGTKGRAKCNVLEDLGVALHASQDFYSHSNWVDIPEPGALGATNPPGLGQDGRAPWLDPRLAEGPPDGLISSCYEGPLETLRCNYGGGKQRIKHQFLNKDLGTIGASATAAGPGRTERGKVDRNFQRAVAAAVQDSRDKWQYFEERILAVYGSRRGTAMICAMRSDDPDRC